MKASFSCEFLYYLFHGLRKKVRQPELSAHYLELELLSHTLAVGAGFQFDAFFSKLLRELF